MSASADLPGAPPALPCPALQIRVWSLESGECEATFSGHRGAVTALRYDRTGALLASGAKDTDVVVRAALRCVAAMLWV